MVGTVIAQHPQKAIILHTFEVQVGSNEEFEVLLRNRYDEARLLVRGAARP